MQTNMAGSNNRNRRNTDVGVILGTNLIDDGQSHSLHPDLVGTTDLKFTDRITSPVDVIFLCMSHGESKKLLTEQSFPTGTRLIDLGNDFRLGDSVHGLRDLPLEFSAPIDLARSLETWARGGRQRDRCQAADRSGPRSRARTPRALNSGVHCAVDAGAGRPSGHATPSKTNRAARTATW